MLPIAIIIAAASIAYTSYLDHNYSAAEKDTEHTYQIHRKYGNPEYRYLNEHDGNLYSIADSVLMYDIIITVIGTIIIIMYERKNKSVC